MEQIVPNKIIWRGALAETAEKFFYPSFYRELSKKIPFFEENFSFRIIPATPEDLERYFLPLYKSEVMSRADYLLNKETVSQDLVKKILTKATYKLLLIFLGEKVVLAALFYTGGGLFVGYRAAKRDTGPAVRHGATIAYWGEKLLFDYAKECGLPFISRGKDTHPFLGKSNVGRPLYKIKVGVRPKAPVEKDRASFFSLIEEEIREKNVPVLYFSNPDSEGYYQESTLYSPKGSLSDSYLNEFQKVFSWAGISLTQHEY